MKDSYGEWIYHNMTMMNRIMITSFSVYKKNKHIYVHVFLYLLYNLITTTICTNELKYFSNHDHHHGLSSASLFPFPSGAVS